MPIRDRADIDEDALRMRLSAKAERVGPERYERAMQLAESYRKRGEYDQAKEHFQTALRERPDSEQARSALGALDELQKMKKDEGLPTAYAPLSVGERLRLEAEAEEEEAEELLLQRGYAASDLFALKNTLQAESGKGWEDDLAETQSERTVLRLLTAGEEPVEVTGGATVRLGEGELIVEGTEEQIREVQRAADEVRRRMLDKTRENTRIRQEQQEELAAKRRADLKRRQLVSRSIAGMGGGTLAGSRAAGAMPLAISFPSVGTTSFPFHMDYAGTSQAWIELVCLKAGTAVVLQGVLAIVVLFLVGAVSWRGARSGLALSLVLALIFAFMLKVGDEALKQYVVMAIVGLCFAAPFVLARWAVLAQRRVAQGKAHAAS
jgi:hypothetical protein